MAKRLPRPADSVRVRLELSADELRLVEDAAHLCRLSVASFVRVALLDAVGDPSRVDAWRAVAERLAAGDERNPPKRPGRPKKPKGD